MASKEPPHISERGSPSLCFKRDEFTKDDFSVDQFVSKHRKNVPLEILRDDLGIYLHIIRSSMIELINKDYADFVNLSSNLVGLDKSIGNLTVPLGQLKEEISTVKEALDEALSSVQNKLEEREAVRSEKLLIQRTIMVLKGIEKMELLLNISYSNEEDSQCKPETITWSNELLERISLGLTEVQFNLSKISGLFVIEEAKSRVQNIVTILTNHLEEMFLKTGMQDPDVLIMVLRSYATLNKTKDLELVFCKRILRPSLEEILTDKKLQQNGLESLYKEILTFVTSKCKVILEVTGQAKKTQSAIKGYDFMVNAIWPEVVVYLESLMPSVFAPGNPNLFHQNYSATVAFLEEFERTCVHQQSVILLRQHHSFTSFMEKWNLLVYFQIRFQEIGGAFETALLSPFILTEALANSPFDNHASFACWSSIEKCWSDKVYLPCLTHKLWKLTLQLLSRYARWIKDVLDSKPARMKEENLSVDISTFNNNNESKFVSNGPESHESDHVSLVQLIKLVSDIEILDQKLTNFFEDVIQPKLVNCTLEDISILQEGLQCGLKELASLPIGDCIVQGVTMQCFQHLKLVADIPRLYRKTNREVPSKPSTYVGNVINHVENFLEENKKFLSDKLRKEWGLQILNGVTQQYLNVTGDVLTSIKRMEDSLKRLKRTRERSTGTSGNSGSGITDDDKIRLQLSLDIKSFGHKIDLLGIEKTSVQGYAALVELVESARISPASNS